MTVIHENEDQVVDFLDRNVVSQVTHQLNGLKTVEKDGSGYAMNMFKTGSNGRLVIAEENVEEEEGRESQKKRDGNGKEGRQEEISEDYYKQSLASEVSFTRTADGRVKFLKRKRGERDDAQTTYENGSADREVGKRWNSGYKSGRKDENGGKDLDYNEMLGRQYKAKKARGDVKKAGMADPYAYIPLSGKIVGNM
jgi:ribosomal RNA-processing protein 12